MKAAKRLAVWWTLGLAMVSCTAEGQDRASWRLDPVWDDGKAEYCAYEVQWSRYGNLYPGRALVIVVKEPWAPDLDVKADRPRDDGFEVLKVNHIRDVPTGIYTYHQMASAFLRRDSGELRKLATTSSEGCGISTATLTDNRLSTQSYFDGEGAREIDFPHGAAAEDALVATLRDYLEGEVPERIEVFPALMTGRFGRLEAESRAVSRKPSIEIEVAAGAFSVVPIEVEGVGTYFFSDRSPFSLVRVQKADGTEYSLAKCERLAYWSMAGPGGEEWLPTRVR